jgi:hypothetical protein
MKTVQVAIQDPTYADSIRKLLLQDGRHKVHVVAMPDVKLAGVIVVDATELQSFPSLAKEQQRLVVVVHKDRDDLTKVWDAGVRHVVFHGDPPHKARIVVLGAELTLCSIHEK